MNIDLANIDLIFQMRPTKDVFQNCLQELIIERNTIKDQQLLHQIDTLISSIQFYLTVATK
jgi:hypothetical protein